MNKTGLSIREALQKFVEQQELVLRDHDHKGEAGWLKKSLKDLYAGLCIEVDELDDALDTYEDTPDDVERKELIRECCDVANFAMMIADLVQEMEKKRNEAAATAER